jgi:hypothetical protein
MREYLAIGEGTGYKEKAKSLYQAVLIRQVINSVDNP